MAARKLSTARKISSACVRKLSKFHLFTLKEEEPSFDLLQLPPEIREKIYHYCTVGQLLELACCSKAHYQSVLYMLWQSVGIPWEHVQEMSPKKQMTLDWLQYTTSLRFYSTSDHKSVFSRHPLPGLLSKPVEFNENLSTREMVENYKLIMNSCDANRLQKMSFTFPFHGIKLPRKLFSRNLRELSLSDDYSVNRFWKDVGNLQLLQKLTIANCAFTDHNVKQIANSKCLQEFNLQWNSGITAEGIKHLSTLKKLNTLSLDGSGLRLRPKSFKHLSKLKNLKSLSLGYSSIDDAVLLHVTSHMKQLKYLSIAGCRSVTDCAILSICSNAASSSLESLNLNYTGITDRGVFSMHMMTSLKQLFLGNTGVTSTGVGYLRHNSLLKELDLSCTSVSDDGVLHLNVLKSLRVVNVRNTCATKPFMARLRRLKEFKDMNIIGP